MSSIYCGVASKVVLIDYKNHGQQAYIFTKLCCKGSQRRHSHDSSINVSDFTPMIAHPPVPHWTHTKQRAYKAVTNNCAVLQTSHHLLFQPLHSSLQKVGYALTPVNADAVIPKFLCMSSVTVRIPLVVSRSRRRRKNRLRARTYEGTHRGKIIKTDIPAQRKASALLLQRLCPYILPACCRIDDLTGALRLRLFPL